MKLLVTYLGHYTCMLIYDYSTAKKVLYFILQILEAMMLQQYLGSKRL